MKHEWTYLLGPLRLPFIILTPACVAVGVGSAIWSTGRVNGLFVVIVMIGAIAAHVSVNAFNEYFDFKSGLDFKTHRTPFSGGSGSLPARPELAGHTLLIAVGTLVLTALVGVIFAVVWGMAILPLGILGLIVIVFYTPWIVRHPFMCLVAPGLGFGPLMVMGTDFALTGHYSCAAFAASLVPFFLVGNLLLLNQFPDSDADRTVGRRHCPITMGRRKSSYIYTLFLCAAYVSITGGVAFGVMPRATLMGLATIILAVPAAAGAIYFADRTERLVPFMTMNVAISVLTPFLVAVGFWWA